MNVWRRKDVHCPGASLPESETSPQTGNSRWKYIIGSGGLLGALAIIIAAIIGRPLPAPEVVTPSPLAALQPQEINSFPFTAFAYQGLQNPAVNAGYAFLWMDQSGDGNIAYRLDYDISEGSEGYGGLAFGFSEPQDISNFTKIQVDIEFLDDGATCDMLLKDISEAAYNFRLSSNERYEDDVQVTKSGSRQVVTIPLKKFGSVNLKAVKEVTFNIDYRFSTGFHTIKMYSIYFLP